MVVCKFFHQGYCRYGQSCRFEHIYGSKYSYRAPQTQNSNAGNQESFGSNASSLFRSAVQNTPTFNNTANNAVFGQNPPRVSVFNRLGDQNSNFNQNNQARSLFAQANQNVFQESQPTNVFQTQNQAKSIFSQATQNVFGSQTNFAAQNNAANLFASATQKASQNNVFDSHMSTSPTITNNIFQTTERPTSNVFGVVASNFEQNSNNDDMLYYSKLEDLSADAIEAFNSAEFKLGYIPEMPPAKSLCV